MSVIDRSRSIPDPLPGVPEGSLDCQTPTSQLVELIVRRHHAFLRDRLPAVDALAQTVAQAHGAHDDDLVALSHAVTRLRGILLPHLELEERVVFPMMLQVEQGAASAALLGELAAMGRDHLEVALSLERIRQLTRTFATPEGASSAHATLVTSLEQVEEDLRTHMHLETNVLMARFVPAIRA